MESRFGFIKTTVVGGFVFLVPVVVVVVALSKLIGFLKVLAETLAPISGIHTAAGGLILDVVAIGITVFLCFVAGLIAKRTSARQLREKLDSTLLGAIPGYAFVKGFADNLRKSEELARSFVPVLVRSGDADQIAFETDRNANGKVAIYFPGAPNPWSGSLAFVSSDRVRPLPMSLTDTIRIIRTLGKGCFEMTERGMAGKQHVAAGK